MIAYETKKEDRKEYLFALDMLGQAIKIYQSTGKTESLLFWQQESERLKNKIDTHDYTSEENIYKRQERDYQDSLKNSKQ